MLTAMKQSSLDLSTKKTRKQELLAQMDRVVPWAALVELIAPYYPEGKNGRPPLPWRPCCAFIACSSGSPVCLSPSYCLTAQVLTRWRAKPASCMLTPTEN